MGTGGRQLNVLQAKIRSGGLGMEPLLLLLTTRVSIMYRVPFRSLIRSYVDVFLTPHVILMAELN